MAKRDLRLMYQQIIYYAFLHRRMFYTSIGQSCQDIRRQKNFVSFFPSLPPTTATALCSLELNLNGQGLKLNKIYFLGGEKTKFLSVDRSKSFFFVKNRDFKKINISTFYHYLIMIKNHLR